MPKLAKPYSKPKTFGSELNKRKLYTKVSETSMHSTAKKQPRKKSASN